MKHAWIIIVGISILMYGLTMRGTIGNPTAHQIEYEQNNAGSPFETSQERSRWAILLSLVNEHRVEIDDNASMGTPDIGRINNHYYSFFPPTMSFFSIPLYLLGIHLGASQLFTFITPMLFTLATMIVLYAFAKKLSFHWSIAVLTALMYGFATSVWGYSVTLYAHAASAFFLLLSIYLVHTSDTRRTRSAIGVWVCYALAVYLDYPNVFIFFPIALMSFSRAFFVRQTPRQYLVNIHFGTLLAPIIFVIALMGYGYYNYVHFGSPTTFSNTIPRVQDLKIVDLSNPEKTKNSGQSLKTRNIVNGLDVYLFSPDRSIVMYSPVILLFLFGLGYLTRRKMPQLELLLIAVPATCFTLYTMFGDPWGGWAFGPRYLMAIMPELILLAGIGLHRFMKNVWVKILYTLVILYGAGVALLAPLTTNVIPPTVEARGLGLDYTYIINWRMLQQNELNSFIYNTYLKHSLSGVQYYAFILAGLLCVLFFLIWIPKHDHTN